MAIVLNPQLIGEWRGALDKDAVVGQQAVNGGSPGNWSQATIDAFSQSPATGCASLLDLARTKSGYNPLGPAPADAAASYNAILPWMNTLMNGITPGLFLRDYDNWVNIGGSGNWPDYVNQAVNTYVGISEPDKARLSASIQQLVNAAYSMPNQPETITMLQNSIQANTDGSVSVYFYSTFAQIIYSVGSGKNATSQLGTTFQIYRSKMNLQLSVYQSQAAAIANQKLSLVKSWLNNMSGTAPMAMNASPATRRIINRMTCFETVPGIQNAITVGTGDDYWRAFLWEELPQDARTLWANFNWDQHNWDGPPDGFPPAFYTAWADLTPVQLQAAQSLGYNEILWDGPSVSEAIRKTNMKAYWHRYTWAQIPPVPQQLWAQLGWALNNWSDPAAAPATDTTPWSSLSPEAQKAAGLLGFAAGNWTN